MNKKIFFIGALLGILFMSTFALALGAGYSYREAPTEVKDVNFNSNGMNGNGYVISGLNGDSRITYTFEQTNGVWKARTQIGRVRYNWQPVTVRLITNYCTQTTTLIVPELRLTAALVPA